MKFKIKSQLLLTNIKKMIKIAPVNPINEIYKNIKVEVEDNKISFYSLNEKTFLKFFLVAKKDNLEIYQSGNFLINLKILYDILNKLNDEWLLFEIKINALIISNFDKDNNFVFKLNTLEIKNFPDISFNKDNQPIALANSIVEEVNNQINFVINTNNSSNILRGINFSFSKSNLLTTGTDRVSMAQKTIPIQNELIEQDITIPIFLLNDIGKVTSDLNQDYLFYLNNDQSLVIENDNFLFKGRLIDGQYPKIQNVITQYLESENKEIIEINNLKTFLNTIDLAVVLAKKELVPLVQLIFDKKNNKIEILCISNNNSFGEVHEQFNNVTFLNQEKNQEKFTIVFNYNLLTYALKTFSKCKKVKLNIVASYNYHTIITSDEDLSLSQLVLPIINNYN
ncbi:DNA polymerase III subunit beta [Spiroplasma platyhelix]|uniref:DNA polymerase III subunit beta n=1 Tax=Spiroplasma platyhelix PALS-1 TaxID=1276218 RepID=A0A846UDH4_9MOLU|nr:DNA polymerase III subunit beta [Spiroplasma platyhelix]MBE4704185.1 Beta sliding clamp [Spiroplasma platyhelix PALS-1]NKE38558.1 DNA polymerase III subunit beta [Spiroplasma platyhelix PALS-1]UJB28769.1 DNA polymerase III subunit beta [Spiroplasma platyhelix PALS-1]